MAQKRISAKEMLLLVKKETTFNVFEAPGVLDWLPCYNIDLVTNSDEITNENDCGRLGSKPKDRVNIHYSLKFAFYLTGSGTPGVPPAYAGLLAACGYREDIFADRVEYTPISDDYQSASIIAFMSDNKFPGKGMRGNVSFEKNPKSYDIATVELLGTYIEADEEANHAVPDCSSQIKPVAIGPENTTLSLLGLTELDIYSLNINSGRSPEYMQYMTTTSTEIDTREMSGDIEIAALPISLKNWDESYGETGALTFVNGTVPGYIVEKQLPNVQVGNHSFGTQGDYKSSKIELNILPLVGDDDIKIVVR